MDYITLIGIEYPNIEVAAINDPNIYENIIWINPLDTISKVDLDARRLLVIKRDRLVELSETCKNVIISGFISATLGADHIYDSEEVDQLNLIGATTATSPTPTSPGGYNSLYACRDTSTGVKDYKLHSHYQLRQVMADGSTFKLTQLQKFHLLRAQVEAAVTEQEVLDIKWT